jgi:hypothetical protein
MSRMTPLEILDHAPEPESLAVGNFCPLLARESIEGMDDMAGICDDDGIRNALRRADVMARHRRFDTTSWGGL